MASALEGVDQVMRALERLRTEYPRNAAAAGTRNALTVMARETRQAIASTNASDRMKRAAKKAIGSRFVKGGTNRLGKTTTPLAKAGFGVGKQSKAKRAAATKRAGDASKSGVGISSANIHWAVLGTKERQGRGAMPAYFKGVLAAAVSSGGEKAIQAFRDAAARELAKAAAKRR